MLSYQKLIYPCPFCLQSATAGSKTSWRRVGEGIILLSEKCSNCGRTAKEIERKWKGLEP
jgi:hypothetical protein